MKRNLFWGDEQIIFTKGGPADFDQKHESTSFPCACSLVKAILSIFPASLYASNRMSSWKTVVKFSQSGFCHCALCVHSPHPDGSATRASETKRPTLSFSQGVEPRGERALKRARGPPRQAAATWQRFNSLSYINLHPAGESLRTRRGHGRAAN